MPEGRDITKRKKDKARKGKGAKDWKEDKVSMLIKLLEENLASGMFLAKIIQNVVLKMQHIKK